MVLSSAGKLEVWYEAPIAEVSFLATLECHPEALQ